jgi:hypothetical protein
MGNKGIVYSLSCTVAVVLLFGCAGFPTPVSTDDTLLVVPVVVIDAQYAGFKGTFGYNIRMEQVGTGTTRTITIMSSTGVGYAYIQGLPEGKYILKEYTTIGLSGSSVRPIETQKYLVLEKGKVSIFPIKIVMTIFDPEDRERFTGTIYTDFIEIDERQEARMLAYIGGKEENFSSWKR